MAQINLFVSEKQKTKIAKLKAKWKMSQHDTILKIIDEFEE